MPSLRARSSRFSRVLELTPRICRPSMSLPQATQPNSAHVSSMLPVPANGSQTALPGAASACEAIKSEMSDDIDVLPIWARDLSEYLWISADEGEVDT
jgi:hypothetical protein